MVVTHSPEAAVALAVLIRFTMSVPVVFTEMWSASSHGSRNTSVVFAPQFLLMVHEALLSVVRWVPHTAGSLWNVSHVTVTSYFKCIPIIDNK